MYDLAYFRSQFDQIAQRLATRANPPNLDQFRDLDARRRTAIAQVEELKRRRNEESARIAQLKREGVDTAEQQKEVRALGEQVSALDERVKALDDEFRELLAGIPNLPHESVPAGKDSEDNLEVRRCGEPRRFDFEPKAHWDLGPELGILDLERAAKITGARFALYWGLGARLERALINFMLDVHTRHHGYTEVLPPFMVNSQIQGRSVQMRRPGFLAHSHRRSAGHQYLPRRNAERRGSAREALCVYALFSQ